MNEELERLTRQRQAAHATLSRLGGGTYAAFLDMERAAYADGSLSSQVKQLVAVGISVVVDCRSCMQWHIERAKAAGATLRQVLEAVDVAMEMGGGPATVSARFALEVLEDLYGSDCLAHTREDRTPPRADRTSG